MKVMISQVMVHSMANPTMKLAKYLRTIYSPA